MTHKIFMVLKDFVFPKHYSTLSKFIEKESRIIKAKSLKEDRCLEFMLEDENTVEFVFRNDVIYARPGQSHSETGIELIIRNIVRQEQLIVISSLIKGSNIVDFVKEVRALEKDKISVYTHSVYNNTKIYAVAQNNGNTIILDGNHI